MTPYGRKQKGTKESLDESERGEWKAGLKLNIQKTKIMTWSSITSWKTGVEKAEAVTDFIFMGSKITEDGDCSHDIKRCLLLGRKTMTNLDRALKSRDITLLTKVCIVKAMVFPVVSVWMWKLIHKEGWATKNWCFWIVMLEKTLENPLDHKEIKLVNPKGNQAWIFTGRTDAEAPMATSCEQSAHWRRPRRWERLKGKRERGGRRWNG